MAQLIFRCVQEVTFPDSFLSCLEACIYYLYSCGNTMYTGRPVLWKVHNIRIMDKHCNFSLTTKGLSLETLDLAFQYIGRTETFYISIFKRQLLEVLKQQFRPNMCLRSSVIVAAWKRKIRFQENEFSVFSLLTIDGCKILPLTF